MFKAAASASLATQAEFMQFIAHHGKSYGTREEYEFRLSIFEKNLAFINEHNQAGEGHTLGLNSMADWTSYEYNRILGYLPKNRPTMAEPYVEDLTSVPKSKDWRKSKAVTEVKNQGNCASGWAFSATGALESSHFIDKNGSLESLSEQ